MGTYEVLHLIILSSMLTISLISLIIVLIRPIIKEKNNHPARHVGWLF
ncbi:MAG: putative holin-like toxin [Tepidanaerobacteraceae bacterium]|nr:putative holin-like toxin [Tepidanaerobacteraceae bacterium]